MSDGLMLELPRVHLNGTSRQVLQEQYRAASDALRLAIEGVEGTSPNARDYYVSGGSYRNAAQEHRSRMERLRSVRAELVVIVDSLEERV